MRIVDQYTNCKPITRKTYQLVGISSLSIAAKMDEIEHYGVGDYVFICDGAYGKNDIHEMERRICAALHFAFDVSRIGIAGEVRSRLDAWLHDRGILLLLASHIYLGHMPRSEILSACVAYSNILAGTLSMNQIGSKNHATVSKLRHTMQYLVRNEAAILRYAPPPYVF
jgi:hypothetical protein